MMALVHIIEGQVEEVNMENNRLVSDQSLAPLFQKLHAPHMREAGLDIERNLDLCPFQALKCWIRGLLAYHQLEAQPSWSEHSGDVCRVAWRKHKKPNSYCQSRNPVGFGSPLPRLLPVAMNLRHVEPRSLQVLAHRLPRI